MTLKKIKDRATHWLRDRRERAPRWLRVTLKVILWIIGSVLGLLILTLIILQTPFAKAWIVEIVEDSLRRQYDADFSIGGLDGILLTGATIHDVTIANPPECKEPYFLVVKETEVEYNPFDMLSGEIPLEVAKIVGVEVILEQMSGGRLNVTEIFSKRTSGEKPPLLIEDARLINALFRFDFLDEEKEDLNFTNLSGKMTLFLENGDVYLTGLALGGRTSLYDDESFWATGGLTVIRHGPVKFNGLSLSTSSSMVYLEGEIEPKKDRIDLELFSPYFSLSELRRVGLDELEPGGDAEISGRLTGRFYDPRIQFSLKLRNPTAAGYLLDELEMSGEYADERLVLDEFRLRRGGGRATGAAVVDFTRELPVVEARLDFYGLDPAELAPIRLAHLPGDFQGRLSVNGDGDPGGGITADLEFFPSRLKGVRIDQFRLSGRGTMSDFAVTDGLLRIGGGRINFNGRITEDGLAFLFNGREVSLEPVGRLFGEEAVGGSVDFNATLAGSLSDLEAHLELLLTRPRFADFSADRARLTGSLSLASSEEGTTLERLLFDLTARDAGMGGNRVGHAQVKGELSLAEGPAFRGEVDLADITAAGRTIAGLEGRVNFDGESGRIEQLHLVVDDEASLTYRGGFALSETGVIFETDLLHAVYRDLDLLNTRSFTTEVSSGGIDVEGLELVSTAGRFLVEGTYSFESREINAQLNVPELDVGALYTALGFTEKPVSGLAWLRLEVTGKPMEPRADLSLTLAGAVYGKYHLRELKLDLNLLPGVNTARLFNALSGREPLPAGGDPLYLGGLKVTARGIGTEGFEVDNLNLDCELTNEGVRLVGLDASLVGGSLDALGRLDLTTVERPVELYLGAYDFPLDELPFLPDSIGIEDGYLTAQGLISGPLDHPRADGLAHLQTRRLNLYKYNLSLDDLILDLTVTPESITLDNMICLIGGGELTGSGTLAYGTGRYTGEAVLKGEGLQVRNLADLFTGTLNLEVGITSGTEGTTVSGLVEILNGEVALPLGQRGAVKVGSPAREGGDSSFNLDLRIVAEKNLWMRSDLADLEVGADLRLTLLGDNLALGGELETKRGSVYFLDKAFDLDEGRISFDRMVPPDPRLSIRASSRMRRRTESQTTEDLTLEVHVGGKLSAPEITLSCAEHPEWPERDIIMLIALDMTWDDYQRMLSEQGARGATRHATSQAAFFLASFIEAKLERLARKAVGLDTLKVEGITKSGEIDRLNVTVGKYVFRDLYLSYSRDMLAEGNQSFSVEYFITDNLSILGSTIEDEGEMGYGLDLKWKFKY